MKFEDRDGFGTSTPEELLDLKKAIDTGDYAYGTSAPGALTGGAAMQVESLDATLKVVSFSMKNIKLWNDIYKDKANSTVEQYNLQQSFGEETSPFMADGGLPNAHDSNYSREFEKVKYMGTLREVTHPATLVQQAHGPAIAREIQSGTKYLVGQMERFLFTADSARDAQQFDGLEKQIRGKGANAEYKGVAAGFGDDESVIIDCRDADVDEDILEDAANRIATNWGVPTDLYIDNKSHSNLTKTFFPKGRIAQGASAVQADGRAGFVLKTFDSAAGTFNLKSDIFLRPRQKAVTGTGNAPGSVTSEDSTEAAGSLWVTADQADYVYGVSAVYSKSGESPAAYATAYTKANNNNVDIDWVAPTPPAGETVLYYNVFRSVKDGANTTAELIAQVSGAVTWRDKNEDLPGRAKAFLLQNDSETICFKQLAPMLKMDLARVAASYRFMLLLYGTPVVFAPRKNVILKNIKK